MGARTAILAALIGTPLALPASLVARYPELATAHWRRGGVFVRIAGWPLGARTVDAITLWRTIFVAPGVALDPALLLHELRHVTQFQSVPAFPVRYLWESVRRGYHANRFEVDARSWASARLARGGADAVTTHATARAAGHTTT